VPLPWLALPLADALATQRGHALLVHGSPGIGALPFALALAQAWLCESEARVRQTGPCGLCGSCRLVQARLHPDLLVLLPETLRREHQWPLVDDKIDGDDGKRKPSRQIRIDEVRGLLDWVFKTSARGRGKVVVLHPAEALNPQSANALLKTLEEPPAGTRVIITAADPALLLPTVRSRCQTMALPLPRSATAAAWLAAQGVAQPEVLLAACSGRPLDALALARAGIDAPAWAALPAAVMDGQAGVFSGWPLPRALDALHKLCHDAMARSVGGDARYFPAGSVPAGAALAAMATWLGELARVARHDDHPWHETLLLEALVGAGATALAAPARADPDGPRSRGLRGAWPRAAGGSDTLPV
jgi:DNA polymerase-3 subunit delta'